MSAPRPKRFPKLCAKDWSDSVTARAFRFFAVRPSSPLFFKENDRRCRIPVSGTCGPFGGQCYPLRRDSGLGRVEFQVISLYAIA
jgi:hypothetical protein